MCTWKQREMQASIHNELPLSIYLWFESYVYRKISPFRSFHPLVLVFSGQFKTDANSKQFWNNCVKDVVYL